jgi:hypothetical protein
MASLHYIFQENLQRDTATLIDRQIEFNVSYSVNGSAKLTVDNQFEVMLCEFHTLVHFPLAENELGLQICGNEDNFFHQPNEFITDPRFASELLAKARKDKPNYPWHMMLARVGDIEEPKLLSSNKENEFYINPTSKGFKVFYPKALGGNATFAPDEKAAYKAIVTIRKLSPIGDNYAIKEPLECAKALWELFSDTPIDNDDYTEKSFLHFFAGTPRFEIMQWFESYFDISIIDDLAVA